MAGSAVINQSGAERLRVLVIEDEARIAADIARALGAAGFVVEVAHEGEDGWYRGDSEEFQAVVLDLGLPKLDGLSVLRRWRAADRGMPVILLTARDGWREKVEGINSGADDYLTKPFHMEELIARVRALTRRAGGHATPVIKAGSVEIDTRTREVSVAGRPVAVSALEYRLLLHLMTHLDRVVPQGELSVAIHGQERENDSNALEALVARLRRKLGVPLIQTRRGHGYVAVDGQTGDGG